MPRELRRSEHRSGRPVHPLREGRGLRRGVFHYLDEAAAGAPSDGRLGRQHARRHDHLRQGLCEGRSVWRSRRSDRRIVRGAVLRRPGRHPPVHPRHPVREDSEDVRLRRRRHRSGYGRLDGHGRHQRRRQRYFRDLGLREQLSAARFPGLFRSHGSLGLQDALLGDHVQGSHRLRRLRPRVEERMHGLSRLLRPVQPVSGALAGTSASVRQPFVPRSSSDTLSAERARKARGCATFFTCARRGSPNAKRVSSWSASTALSITRISPRTACA